MASMETWDKLRYFKRGSKVDNFGNEVLISDDLLLKLDDFRHYVGVPVIVTHGVKTSGHNPNSFHYPRMDDNDVQIGACAVDVVLPTYNYGPYNLLLDALRFGFTGLGFYPHWKFRGRQVGGLHLDARPLKWDSDFTKNYKQSRWMGVKDESGKQVYVALNMQNLVKYCGDMGSLIG